MDHSRFNTTDDGFDVVALRADFEFKTAASISFTLHDEGYVRGWVDVHHPCSGHIKLRIRGHMNESRGANLSDSTARQIVAALVGALGIPAGETYEAAFFGRVGQWVYLEQRVDRDGMTDML